MSGIIKLQQSFAKGAFSGTMRLRNDLEPYDQSAKRIENMMVIPQGGLRRRFGTIYVDDITAFGEPYRIVEFAYSETQHYLFVFYDDNIAIYLNDVLGHTITSTGITGDQINEFDYAQTTNLMIITHPDFNPKQISRTGLAITTFAIADVDFAHVPAYD